MQYKLQNMTIQDKNTKIFCSADKKNYYLLTPLVRGWFTTIVFLFFGCGCTLDELVAEWNQNHSFDMSLHF
jgi:hypothetical protein